MSSQNTKPEDGPSSSSPLFSLYLSSGEEPALISSHTEGKKKKNQFLQLQSVKEVLVRLVLRTLLRRYLYDRSCFWAPVFDSKQLTISPMQGTKITDVRFGLPVFKGAFEKPQVFCAKKYWYGSVLLLLILTFFIQKESKDIIRN